MFLDQTFKKIYSSDYGLKMCAAAYDSAPAMYKRKKI